MDSIKNRSETSLSERTPLLKGKESLQNYGSNTGPATEPAKKTNSIWASIKSLVTTPPRSEPKPSSGLLIDPDNITVVAPKPIEPQLQASTQRAPEATSTRGFVILIQPNDDEPALERETRSSGVSMESGNSVVSTSSVDVQKVASISNAILIGMDDDTIKPAVSERSVLPFSILLDDEVGDPS